MADLQKTIEIIFGVTDDGASTGVANIAKQFDNFDSAVQNAAKPLGALANDILATTAALGAMGIAFAGVAAATAGGFDAGIREIGSLFNATEKELSGLSETLLAYGRDSTATFEEIQQASYIAISTGTQVEALTQTLTAAEQLAVAGATSLDSATGALTRSLNAYGVGAEEATNYSEALFVAVQKGDTTMEQLANNLGKVATIAKNSGVDFDELLAALDGLTIAGISTAESTTQLRALFKELASPSEALTTALGGMTVEANGLQAVMQQLKTVTGGSQAEMAELFGSTEAVTAALVLANDSAGAFGGALDALADKAGKLGAAYGTMVNTFENNNQRFINNLKATLVDVGTPILDDYGEIITGLNGVLAGLGEGVQAPNFTAVYDSLDVFAVRIREFLEGVGTALPDALAQLDFTGLTSAITELGNELSGVFEAIFGGGLDLTVPEDLAEVLQKVVNLITGLVQVTAGIIDELRPVFEFLGEAADSVAGLDEETAKFIGNFLGAAKLLADFGTVLGGILIVLKETDTELGNVLNNLGAAASVVINAMQAAFDAFAVVIFKTAETLAKVGNLVTFGDVAQEFRDSSSELALLGDAAAANLQRNLGEMGDAWDQFGSSATDTTKEISTDMQVTAEETAKLAPELDSATTSMTKLGQAGDKANQALSVEKLVEDAVKASEATKKLQLDLEKVASQERIELKKLDVSLSEIAGKTYEAKIKLDIAEAEANAKQMVAAFDSIGSTITSTGDVLGTLFNKTPADWVESLRIQDAVEFEQKIRQEAANQQNELIQAQIAYFDAQTQSLKDGLSEITITAEGLEPELEAFMWAILDRIKIRATQDQANFLLGTL